MSHLKGAVTRISVSVSKAQKAKRTEKEEKGMTEATSSPFPAHHSEGARLNLELPTFNGDPKLWQHFKDMFQATKESRGKHLKHVERRYLLLKFMDTKEARAIVQSHADGDYDAALEALTQKLWKSSNHLPSACTRVGGRRQLYL